MNKTDPADVSVVVPVHDRAALLTQALASIAAQRTSLGIEVIVVDDRSEDDSATVAKDHGCVVIELDHNVGPGRARRVGIEAATGSWIAFLDSDDAWSSRHLERLWNARADHVLVASSAVTDADGPRVLGNPSPFSLRLRSPKDLLRPENVVVTSACMVRADALANVGGFSVERYAEDLETWGNVLTVGTGIVLSTLTVSSRTHESQLRATSTMLEGSARMVEMIDERGWLRPESRRALRAAAAWDALRASRKGAPDLFAAVCRGEPHLGPLLNVLARRAALRHRWRLTPRQARAIAQLLTVPSDDARAIEP